jgi:FHS family L-fucose permease-like MFS transporter
MANETVRDPRTRTQERLLVPLVVFLFFAWGFATVLIDSLVPKLKGLFSLNYVEVLATQFSFFIGYFFFAIPAALILSRFGYIRSAVIGLVVMAAGCLLFAPAADLGVYPAFLFALFVMSAGATILQVSANPFIELLGPEKSSHSRLTLAQAFNSLATTIGPWVGALTILSGGVSVNSAGLSEQALAALRRTEAHAVQFPFLVIAAALIVIAFVFWRIRNDTAPRVTPEAARIGAMAAMLKRPRVALGALAIFVYVGAEVYIGSVMTNYLLQPTVLGTNVTTIGRAIGSFIGFPGLFSSDPAACANQFVIFYWGGAMIGRFIGSYVLSRARPGYVLSACAVVACTLALISSQTTGHTAAFTVLAIGLFNSIMFPTIFALSTEQLGPETPNGSGLLVMAIVGGAIVPELAAHVADSASPAVALFVPAACYVCILIYGILAARGLGLPEQNAPG